MPLLIPSPASLSSTPARPRTLFAQQSSSVDAADTVERYLTQNDCDALFRRIVQLTQRGDTLVTISSIWKGTTNWVRNEILESSDRVDHNLTITRIVQNARGSAVANQLDDDSLRLAISMAERQVTREMEDASIDYVSGPRAYSKPDLFKATTYDLLAAGRSSAARELVAPAVAHGVLAAGCLEARVDATGVYDTKGLASYYAGTNARYSVTVRDSSGTASGWAGVDNADWARIDAAALSMRALEKCLASVNPVAIEPGRYTVILEPQAVYDLFVVSLWKEVLLRLDNEKYDRFPYSLRRAPRNGVGLAKFGLQLLDERLTISTDPEDPDAGYFPFDDDGMPYQKANWIEQGVLRQLPYDLDYALSRLGKGAALPPTLAFRMSGGPTSLDEMIATTERGLLITRFTNVQLIDKRSVLATGTTADGTWLIEHGQRSRPVKNFRFNMSPLLAFNAVEQLGLPQRVFAPGAPAIVPAAKLRDFNLTSSSDTI
jgi:predicted Zn-dependent protease